MSSEESKSNFTFAIFIVGAFLLLMVDMSFVFFSSPAALNGLIIPKDSDVFSTVFNFLLKLKKSALGNYFINKFLIIVFIGLASAVKQVKKIPKTGTEDKRTVYNYIVYALLSAGALITSKFYTEHFLLGYIAVNILFFFLFGYYMAKITTFFNSDLLKDRFGEEGRKFKQTEVKIENEYSVNIKTSDGWINVINPFRSSMVIGTPGSGKTYTFLLEAIEQHIKKGFAMYVYDFKFPDLSQFAYNCYVRYKGNFEVKPDFCVINFDDPERTHRSNPLQPELLYDFTDAVESAKSILMGLNKSWIEKEGDFFVEGPINFVSACIWALKLEQGGRYCSLPHVIELVSLDYEHLFGFLSKFEEDASIQNVLAPFLSAYKNQAFDQLEGLTASVRQGLSRLTSPVIYYVMTTGGEEYENISLDINNPRKPKILCIGNNAQRQQVYGPCISLYNSTIIRLVNQKNKLKSALIWDELPTLSFPRGTLDNLIATARSNKVATWLGFQDKQQLIRDAGEKNAKAIFNTIGNVFTGMVTGETAEELSKTFGKIKVLKRSHSIQKGVVSESYSEELQEAIPASKLTTMGQGEFAGLVADDFDQVIEQKFFHSKVIIDVEYRNELNKHKIPKIFDFEKAGFTKEEILNSVFRQVRSDIKNLTR